MDNSKPLMIPLVLKGENYLLWARTAKTNLSGKGLWNHIEPKNTKETKKDSEKSKDEDLTPEEEKWYQEDQVVLASLQNSLEISILEGYSYCETAKELWDTLKVVYGDVSNLTKVFEVKKALNNLHQEDMEFKKHFGRYRSLLAELDMLRPSTMDPKVIRERKEQDNVFGLLMTLNPNYNDLVKHILRGSTLPNLEEVCSQIQKEQGSFGLFNKEEMPSAHVVEAPTANKVEFRRPIVCDHCKKSGHKKAQCWFLHPHLRPNRESNHRESNRGPSQGHPRANYVGEASNGPTRREDNHGEMLMKKSDVEALIQAMTTKMNSGSLSFQKFEIIA